jgi:predicted Zn-dependent protease
MILGYWYAGARDAHDGHSVYSRRGGGTRIGETLVRPEATLFSDPSYTGLECAPYAVTSSSGDDASVFDNGLPLGRTDWIDHGRLAALRQTRETAALTGQPVTPAIDNLVLEVDGARGSLDDLVAGTERGLLLTCLWYIRAVDLLRRFTHASATGPAFSREWGDDYFSRTAMPALRVPDFNMSSVSQAR